MSSPSAENCPRLCLLAEEIPSVWWLVCKEGRGLGRKAQEKTHKPGSQSQRKIITKPYTFMVIFQRIQSWLEGSFPPLYVASFKKSWKTINLTINKMALRQWSSNVLIPVISSNSKDDSAKKLPVWKCPSRVPASPLFYWKWIKLDKSETAEKGLIHASH